jgi:hypothetical protein
VRSPPKLSSFGAAAMRRPRSGSRMGEEEPSQQPKGFMPPPMSFHRHIDIGVAFTNDPEETLLGEATWIRS